MKIGKLYSGLRRHDGTSVAVLFEGTGPRKLDPRHDLMNHSPDGFEWGYHGSGPAQLALAILADATGDDAFALVNYQDFKRAAIADLKEDNFRIDHSTVVEWVATRK